MFDVRKKTEEQKATKWPKTPKKRQAPLVRIDGSINTRGVDQPRESESAQKVEQENLCGMELK